MGLLSGAARAEGRSPRDLSASELKAASDSIASELAASLRTSTSPISMALGKFEGPAGYDQAVRLLTDDILGSLTATGAFQVWSTGAPALGVSGSLTETADGWTVSVRVLDLATGKLRSVVQRNIAAPQVILGPWRAMPFVGVVFHAHTVAPAFGAAARSPTGRWDLALSLSGSSHGSSSSASPLSGPSLGGPGDVSSVSHQLAEVSAIRSHLCAPLTEGVVPRIGGGLGLALSRVKLAQTNYILNTTTFKFSEQLAPASVTYQVLPIVHAAVGLDLWRRASASVNVGYSLAGKRYGQDGYPLQGLYYAISAGVLLP